MVASVPIGDAIPIGIDIHRVASSGLVSAGLTALFVQIGNWIASMLGLPKFDPRELQHLFREGVARLVDLPAQKVGTLNLPMQQTMVLTHASFGGIVLTLAVATEVLMILSATVGGFASYYLWGITLDLTSIYHGIVAAVVLLTTLSMLEGGEYIKQQTQYA